MSSTATVAPWGVPTGAPYGSRDQANLQSCFPKSPLWTDNNDYTETVVYDIGVSAFNGNGGSGDSYTGNVDGIVNDGGWDYSSFNLNFKGTDSDPIPNLDDVETGGGGLPASPYMPNPASPGPGSTSYTDQPEYTGTIPEGGGEYGVGLG